MQVFVLFLAKNVQIGNIEEQVYKIQHLNMFWEGSLSNKERCAYVLFFLNLQKSVCCDVYLFSDWSGCGRIRHSQSCKPQYKPTRSWNREYNCLSLCIMAFLKDTKRQGKYVISPELLESDMKYLKENGYTPVFMQDVIDYVKMGHRCRKSRLSFPLTTVIIIITHMPFLWHSNMI